MRKPLLLAGLALLPLAPLAAQPRAATAAAAPKLELTAEQRAELDEAVRRGRALAAVDRAGLLTRDDMLRRVPDAEEASIEGWIALPEGNGVAVTYYVKEGDGFAAIYRTQIIGTRLTSPQIFAAGSRPALTGAAARMAAAREAAEALDHQPCNGPGLNYLILPVQGDGPTYVYQMSPRMVRDKVPGGGYYRTTVAPDGSVSQSTPLAPGCSDVAIPDVPAGERPRPITFVARDATLPNELHVFMSLWVQRPVVVSTGADPVRLWGVTGQGIGELQR